VWSTDLRNIHADEFLARIAICGDSPLICFDNIQIAVNQQDDVIPVFHHEIEVFHDGLPVQFFLLPFAEVAGFGRFYDQPCHAGKGQVDYAHDHPEHGYLAHEPGKDLRGFLLGYEVPVGAGHFFDRSDHLGTGIVIIDICLV